jgi:hypothetical protein
VVIARTVSRFEPHPISLTTATVAGPAATVAHGLVLVGLVLANQTSAATAATLDQHLRSTAVTASPTTARYSQKPARRDRFAFALRDRLKSGLRSSRLGHCVWEFGCCWLVRMHVSPGWQQPRVLLKHPYTHSAWPPAWGGHAGGAGQWAALPASRRAQQQPQCPRWPAAVPRQAAAATAVAAAATAAAHERPSPRLRPSSQTLIR